MNRSLGDSGPAKTVQLLHEQCERKAKQYIEAPAPYNSRTCSACGSRNTKLSRTRATCLDCTRNADRDTNAAANALKWAINEGAVPAPGGINREVSARQGSTPAPRCPVPPESLGLKTALAREEPSKLLGQHPNGRRQDICPCRKPKGYLSRRTDRVLTHNNRRTFLRHGTDWTPDDFASVLNDATGRIVAHPRRIQLSRQWTEVAREAPRAARHRTASTQRASAGGWSAASSTISHDATPSRALRRQRSVPGGSCARSR